MNMFKKATNPTIAEAQETCIGSVYLPMCIQISS